MLFDRFAHKVEVLRSDFTHFPLLPLAFSQSEDCKKPQILSLQILRAYSKQDFKLYFPKNCFFNLKYSMLYLAFDSIGLKIFIINGKSIRIKKETFEIDESSNPFC